MLTPFPPKTPLQMRREAEQRVNPVKQTPIGPVDPANLPPLAAEPPREVEATIEWLAHVQAGRIEVK